MKNEIAEWIDEDVSLREDCNLCKETKLTVGEKTPYGGVIIYRIGSLHDGWFATLSPKTGGLEKDFTIQLMPFKHLTHFCQMSKESAKNYGLALGELTKAMSTIMAEEEPEFKATADMRPESISVATYGKCTNWKDKKEHLHIKLFPFRGDIGQPYTVDSSFGKKEVFQDNAEEYVKMNPVRKVMINKKRFDELKDKLLALLK